jgi:hypothetical protein
MIYQMPNGKIIEMSVEQYLDMTDDDFQDLMANNYGEEVEDPWFGSVLTSTKSYPDIPEIEDLTQISFEDKIKPTDLDLPDTVEE